MKKFLHFTQEQVMNFFANFKICLDASIYRFVEERR